jgi:hypothetical protein
MGRNNSAQVQTNEHKVNVLVETKNSSNSHYCHLNRDIEVVKVLTDDEIIDLWKKRKRTDELVLAKDWVKKQDGYAVSNCFDESLDIHYNSVISYRYL